jgi:hypothetical protein
MSTRSIMLTRSTELAEAGVEQALYSFNNGDWSSFTTSGNVATATLTMTSSGLVPSSQAPTPLNYGNGMTGQVNITVNNYNTTTPWISSQALFTLPTPGGGNQTTTSGTITYSAPASPATSAAPVFVNAVATTSGAMRFTAGGYLDSYNSNPSAGVYRLYAASTAGYSAVLVSQDMITFAASVRIGSTTVHGYASGYNAFFPGTTNWLSYGALGSVVGPGSPVGASIDSSRLLSTPVPYQPVFPEILPANYQALPGASTSDGVTLNLTCTLGSTTATAPVAYNYSNGIILTAGQVVTIQGPVVLVCNNTVQIAGGSEIVLTTPQASLQILLESGSLQLGGNGIVNTNPIPLPKKVAILSTNNTNSFSDSVTLSQAQPFYGVIYFPSLPVTVSMTQPIFGSIVGSKFDSTTALTLHYDLALRNPMPPYTSAIPLQSGAAFDDLSAPAAFSNMASTTP